jgi:hypothetical protein
MNILYRIMFKFIKFPMFETTEVEKQALRFCENEINHPGITTGEPLDWCGICSILNSLVRCNYIKERVARELKKSIRNSLYGPYLEDHLNFLSIFISKEALRKEWIRQLLAYKK